MSHGLRRICLVAIASFPGVLAAQSVADYAVQLSAAVQIAPPAVTLQWKKINGATGYAVSRKLLSAQVWTHVFTTAAGDSSYIDNNVVADSAYEYKVASVGGAGGTGYLYAGLRKRAVHGKGTILLLAEDGLAVQCVAGIGQLAGDLRADGYAVQTRYVPRTGTAAGTKAVILGVAAAHPDLSALYILGHVPVPYSGDNNPDGHADHTGAWPADGYYGDLNGNWTDNTINDVAAARVENDNVPGDGKFDQSFYPSDIELGVGRVDFANMPAFGKTEVQMINAYLDRAHRYKTDQLALRRRGLVDDNFGVFSGEAFAANAYRAFGPLIGRDSVKGADFISTLDTAAYQWAYGCGAGSYTSAGGIGTTTNFVTRDVRAIFTMLFGSYFGDWDAQNSFLRAPLCADTPALTSCWAGRPNWFFHTMGLGQSIGEATKRSMNNGGTYAPENYGATGVHMGLMGDPTLRQHFRKPVQGFAVMPAASGAQLSWNPSPEPGLTGYYVYRSDAAFGQYARISTLLSATTFVDSTGMSGKKFYMVRPAFLEQSPSGTYENLALGAVDSAMITYPNSVTAPDGRRQVMAWPNPGQEVVWISGSDAGAQTVTVRVVSAAGVVVKDQTLAISAGKNPSFPISTKALPPGIYTIAVQESSGRISTIRWTKH